MPLGGLHPIQLVRLTVLLLHIGLQRCEVGVIVILHTAAAQADGQPVRGGAAGISQLVPGEEIVAIFQAQRRALLRQNALNGLGDLRHRVLALGHDLPLILLLCRFRLLRRHGRNGDIHIGGERAVFELHAANGAGLLQRCDIPPSVLSPLGVLTYLYLHRAGEEIGMLQRHGLHIVQPVDGDTAGGFIFAVFAHLQSDPRYFPVGQVMAFLGSKILHISVSCSRRFKYPIGQVISLWGVDGDAVSRRVSRGYHAEYQHQRQQKRRQILRFSSHRGIPPVSVYIAVFAWAEIPPTRIGRLLP